MRFSFKSLLGRLSGQAPLSAPPLPRSGKSSARGILVFTHTSDAIAAQRVLEAAGIVASAKGPPPVLQTGCDMVIEFPLVETLHIINTLTANNVKPLEVVAVDTSFLEPVSLYHVKDFGQWLMVRAANMKITVDKTSRIIVNVSGGGCPDVPWLASCMTGKTLEEAPHPKKLGQTLCGYALQLAFAEVTRQCRG